MVAEETAEIENTDEENQDVSITPDLSYGKEVIAAQVKQAEAEAQLAKEVSRIGTDEVEENESDLGKTRVLDSIRRMPAASRMQLQRRKLQNRRQKKSWRWKSLRKSRSFRV